MADRKKSRKSEPKNVHFSFDTGQPSNFDQGQGQGSTYNPVIVNNGGNRGVKNNPYYSWQNRYGEQVPNNSQESLLLTDDDDFEKFDSRLYLGDTKSTAIKKMQRDIQTRGNDEQDKLKKKYMMQNPNTYERNEKLFETYDPDSPVVQENTKKHVDMMDMRHRLKKGFRFMHALFVVTGIGLMVAGFCVDYVVSDMMGTLGINLASMAKHLFIGSGAAIIGMAIIGQIVVIVYRFKILTWLIYLLVLCLGACSTGSAGFTSISNYRNHALPRTKLVDLMGTYNGKNGDATRKWDAVHQGYKCCGVDNFTDWNKSPFGRTSLRTPMSCCKNYTVFKDEFCGQNLLPHTSLAKANKTIYAEGCIKVMMNRLDLWYLITGVYGILVAFVISFHFMFCFFLIASHRL